MKNLVQVRLIGGVLAITLASACGTITDLSLGAGTNTYVYAVNATTRTVTPYVASSSGSLTVGTAVSVGTSGTPRFPVIDATNAILFVGDSAASNVWALTVGSGGVLTKETSAPKAFTGHTNTQALAVVPSKRFLFVGDGSSTKITPATYTTAGVITLGTTVNPATNVKGLVASSDGAFLYAQLQGGTVQLYTINQTTGALTAGTATTVTSCTISAGQANAQTMQIVGGALFVLCDSSGTAHRMAITTSTGALAASSQVLTGVTSPVSLEFNSAGTFAYVSGTAFVNAYSVNGTTGALTALTGTGATITTGLSTARGLSIDSATGTVFVVNNVSAGIGTVLPLSAGATGALTAGTAVATGAVSTDTQFIDVLKTNL